jgi:hypothetical protein
VTEGFMWSSHVTEGFTWSSHVTEGFTWSSHVTEGFTWSSHVTEGFTWWGGIAALGADAIEDQGFGSWARHGDGALWQGQ